MWVALGLITVPTATAPVRLVDRLSVAQKQKLQAFSGGLPTQVHGFLLQAWKGNTDEIYIGDSAAMTKAGADLAATLAAPGGAQPASYSVALTHAPNAVGLDAVYLMADVANEGVLLSALVN